MRNRIVLALFLTVAGTCVLRAQDYPVTPVDGPSIKVDTLSDRPRIMPQMPFLMLPAPGVTSFLPVTPGFETKEQQAARIKALTTRNVVESVNRNLSPYRSPDLTPQQKTVLYAAQILASLFLTPQISFPYGYIPMVNSSFPFIFAKVPDSASAPYASKYLPEQFPQTIKSEYDPATGTYKQVMVEWNEYQKELSNSLGRSFYSAPVPNVPVTPVDRAIRDSFIH